MGNRYWERRGEQRAGPTESGETAGGEEVTEERSDVRASKQPREREGMSEKEPSGREDGMFTVIVALTLVAGRTVMHILL
ncbi:hypothetical protein EYF80_030913 [Liparis tanakae]|uniref:Uncharacterized protein n=1 Tax=Liparis tanakae TaxID=230148 RepID=A0A4Z2H1E3_9TELE|nr:hypothetical protein EYF80_030913 [Liparis tanakae]